MVCFLGGGHSVVVVVGGDGAEVVAVGDGAEVVGRLGVGRREKGWEGLGRELRYGDG